MLLMLFLCLTKVNRHEFIYISFIITTHQIQMETSMKNIFIFATMVTLALPVIASDASKTSVTLYGIADAGYGLCCINQREAKLPQTPGAAMPRPPFGACPVQ